MSKFRPWLCLMTMFSIFNQLLGFSKLGNWRFLQLLFLIISHCSCLIPRRACFTFMSPNCNVWHFTDLIGTTKKNGWQSLIFCSSCWDLLDAFRLQLCTFAAKESCIGSKRSIVPPIVILYYSVMFLRYPSEYFHRSMLKTSNGEHGNVMTHLLSNHCFLLCFTHLSTHRCGSHMCDLLLWTPLPKKEKEQVKHPH